MSTVKRTELILVFASVVVMALILGYIRFDQKSANDSSLESLKKPAVIVVDETDPNQQAALADAIIDATVGARLQSLIIDDQIIGEGEEVVVGDTVSVHYIGRLQNGQEFDNSYSKGQPFTFEVGTGRVIQGWDEGVVGMRVGGKRALIIPSEFAYGDSGAGPIPGGATLVFAIELLEIK